MNDNLKFQTTKYRYGLDVMRRGRIVATIQWPPEREPHFEARHGFESAYGATEFTSSELREMADRLDEEAEKSR